MIHLAVFLLMTLPRSIRSMWAFKFVTCTCTRNDMRGTKALYRKKKIEQRMQNY